MRTGLVLYVLIALCGCNGQAKQYVDSADYPKSGDDPASRGIRVYMPALFKVTQATTTFVDPISKSTSYACEGVPIVQIVTRCDYSTPLRLRYDPGLFETNSFGATLGADGCLLGVNSQSTPPTSAVTTFIPAMVTALAAAAPQKPGVPTPKCTGDPVTIRMEKCQPNGTCSVN